MSEQFVQINVIGSRAQRLTYTAPGEVLIETVQISDFADENLLLKTLYSGISRGTESLVFKGQVPESEWETMRCPFMAGDFSFPVTYGYACVAEVIKKGASVTDFEIGDHVFVLHPHQTIISVPAASCSKIPSGISPKRAVLAANMETALNAVWDAEVTTTPNCLVIGAGVVGLLTAYLARTEANLNPVLIDTDENKRAVVEQLGFPFFQPMNTEDVERLGQGDLIFHTSASGAGLQTAIDMCAFEGKIIEMSWYGAKSVTLSLGGAFHSKRLKIVSSQVGAISPAKRTHFDFSKRMQKAISLLEDPNLESLLEPEIKFTDIPQHLHDIFNPQSNALCQVIDYT